MRKNIFKKIVAITFAAAITFTAMPSQFLRAEEPTALPIDPYEATYGYFVKNYSTNTSENMTPESNASIALLSKYLELWQPGDTWSTGKKLNEEVLNLNIATAHKISAARTEEETEKAYQIEFNDQNFTVLYGLGDLTQKFFQQAGIVEKTASVYPNNSKNIFVTLSIMQQMRGLPVSTTQAKNYYQYPRPYRWSENGSIIANSKQFNSTYIVPKIIEDKGIADLDAATDGGFPSGHTNAVFICALGLAYAVPEKYADVVLYASEMGKSRILAGMHSPLDVMGGRMTGTAFATAYLATTRASVKNNAVKENKKYLLDEYVYAPATQADYETYKKNLETYLYNMTFEFTQIGDTTQPMRVPYGAESLLESRYPYLTAENIRYILYTTGLPSGYPLLDDDEGWGRLNLYAAANGYASFITDVTVNMDAEKGGLNSCDSWMNDIDGAGSLTLNGSGTLALAGNNTYTGGTTVNGGTLVAANENALGSGRVAVNGATLSENVTGPVNMSMLLTDADSTLSINLASDTDTINVEGIADINGKIVINLAEGYTPAPGNYTILTAGNLSARNASYEVNLGDINGKVGTYGDKVVLTVEEKAVPTVAPTETPATPTPDSNVVEEPAISNNNTVIFVVIGIAALAIVVVVVVIVVRKKKEK